MNKLWALAFVAAAAVGCTCSGAGKGDGGGGGSGSGSAVPPRDPAKPLDPRCAAARPSIEALYRAEAQGQKLEAARAEEMVRDNTEMVLNECASRPEAVAACAPKAKSSQALEADCLRPLDDEGTEGATLRD